MDVLKRALNHCGRQQDIFIKERRQVYGQLENTRGTS